MRYHERQDRVLSNPIFACFVSRLVDVAASSTSIRSLARQRVEARMTDREILVGIAFCAGRTCFCWLLVAPQGNRSSTHTKQRPCRTRVFVHSRQ